MFCSFPFIISSLIISLLGYHLMRLAKLVTRWEDILGVLILTLGSSVTPLYRLPPVMLLFKKVVNLVILKNLEEREKTINDNIS